MKKKRLIIIIIIIFLASILITELVIYLLGKKNQQRNTKGIFFNRKQQDRTEEYIQGIPGLWQSEGSVYYRFYEDGTGHTWDTDDDISEEEASPFEWQISNGNIVLTHKMRIKGMIPRLYQIDGFDGESFQFHDAYSTYALKSMEDSVFRQAQ